MLPYLENKLPGPVEPHLSLVTILQTMPLFVTCRYTEAAVTLTYKASLGIEAEILCTKVPFTVSPKYDPDPNYQPFTKSRTSFDPDDL